MTAGDEREESTGSHGGWDQVAETAQIFEAELIALRLRESGIEAEVVDQTFNQEPLPNVRSFSVVRVLVPEGAGGRGPAHSSTTPSPCPKTGGDDSRN